MRYLAPTALTLAAFLAWIVGSAPGEPMHPAAPLRRPVDAVFLADGRTVAVANHRSGTISLLDLESGRVHDEVPVGGRLTGLASLPDQRHLLVTDEERHELTLLRRAGTTLAVEARLAVGPYPASVAVQPDGRSATVACLWSRRVDVVDLVPAPRIRTTLRLPFAPRNQCVLPRPGHVVVADAFGGSLAVIDTAAGRLLGVQALTGHNLRGLAVARDQLVVAHQVLDEEAAATRVNIERGVLMANVLRFLPLEQLYTREGSLDASSRLVRLGTPGRGAGDPAGVACLADGRLAVALAGVSELALLQPDGTDVRRLGVGRRPTAVLPWAPGRPLVVVNTFGDSLSLVEQHGQGSVRSLPLGPEPRRSYRDRGEELFFDARLSRDGWLSCHSCHTDGHTNGLRADTLGDGTYGTPKRTLTLRHTVLTDPWAWNGGEKYLHDQVERSLAQTMSAPGVQAEHVDDLVTFLHALPPPPPLEPATPGDATQVERGRQVFQEQGCVRCHIPPLTYSSHGAVAVGFRDERGLNKFNPPSLRGVGQGYRFLHDGRAASLEEVFTQHGHQVGDDLPPADLVALLRFLRSL